MIINKNFTPDDNFWHLNPQLIYIKPFSDLYSADKSKGKIKSSNDMWTIFFMEDPDEEKNLFFRIPKDERLTMLKEVYNISYDEKNPLILKCIDEYYALTLNSTERNLKDMKELLTKRSKMLLKMDYNIETGKFIDDALAKNLKIYEDLKKLQETFDKSQKEIKARGQRNLTLSEKGLL